VIHPLQLCDCHLNQKAETALRTFLRLPSSLTKLQLDFTDSIRTSAINQRPLLCPSTNLLRECKQCQGIRRSCNPSASKRDQKLPPV
ncbi:hypothetical protein GOODEAATRI_017153, partial [Goodea atripinnis]